VHAFDYNLEYDYSDATRKPSYRKDTATARCAQYMGALKMIGVWDTKSEIVALIVSFQDFQLM